MTLPELAIRRPVTTMTILVSIVVVGAIALARLPLAFMPEHEEQQVWIIVPYANASPKTVERTVLRPLEEALGSIEGLGHMWSRAGEDGARVSLFFGPEQDVAMKKVEIRERIDRVRSELPEDVDRIFVSTQWDPGRSGETILDARIAADRDLSHGYDLLYDKIVKPLLRIPGVAHVDLDGVNPREVRINLRLADLERYRVDVRDVAAAIRENHLERSLGLVRTDDANLLLRMEGRLDDPDEIRELPLGGGIRLKDVADVTYEEPPLEYGRHLDGKFALGIGVNKESSANTIEISKEIHRRVAEMAEDPELDGVNFLVWEDQGKEILSTIRSLQNTGLMGALLAALVLYLFLRRLSPTVWVVASIPFSLIVACGVIWAKGGTLNTISLLGLIVGVGMLVDNAVVVMENIDRYQRMGLEPRAAALLGSREVSVAVITATLTSMIVFLPIFFGPPNEMNVILRELGMVVCFTLAASLFVSQTMIPFAASRFVQRKRDTGEGKAFTRFTEGYARVLEFTLDRKWLAPVVGMAVIGSAVYPVMKVDKNMETSPAEMFVGIRYNMSEPTPLERREELASQVEAVLADYREEFNLRAIYSFYSRDWTMTRLYMEEGFTNEAWMNRVRRRLPEILPAIAGVKLEVEDNVPFWQRNRGKRVGFRLTGEDTEVLSRLAEEGKRLLEGVPGLHSHYSSAEGGKFEVQTRVDRDRARAYGVGVDQAADVVELTFRGRQLPQFLDGDDEVQMSLRLDEQEEESLSQLHNLPLRQAGREGVRVIPLDTVADFAVVKGPEEIARDGRVTGVWVGARFDEGEQEEYIRKGREALAQLDLPYGYKLDENDFDDGRDENRKDFLINLLLALGLIFAVMAGLFESTRQALSLLVSLPFALAGAAWTLWLTGTDFDQPAAVGLLLLFGIVVNNGIVMIEHINMYRRTGLTRRAAMMRGGRERLRPVMMTALTTLLGLLPIVIRKPSLAGVYYYSMALVIIGGLLISTVLTTVLLPTTVCITEDVLDGVSRRARALGARLGLPRLPRWERRPAVGR